MSYPEIKPLPKRPPHLTTREIEIVFCLARGYSNEDISRALKIAIPSVKVFVSRLYAKIDSKGNRRVTVALAAQKAIEQQPADQPIDGEKLLAAIRANASR